VTLPRVSVIVPTRGRAETLERLLGSLSCQSYKDFEVIVVNDGSEREVTEVLARAAGNGLRLDEVTTAGVGAVEARRLGVEQARGDVLAFTDSDCVADAGWLAAGVRALDDADADLVQGLTVPERHVEPLERSVAHSVDDGLFATCNIFYRRSAFDAAGGFDGGAHDRLGFRADDHAKRLGFGEDTLLGWTVARAGRVADARDAVVRHEVVRPSVPELFSRAWQAGGFPALYREVPELEGRVVQRGIVLGKPGPRLLTYAMLAALFVRRPIVALLTAVLWALLRVRAGEARARTLPVQLALDATTCAALVLGSIRARKLVI
jgi:glycosyltransferase involved in cell wall biosynthesis